MANIKVMHAHGDRFLIDIRGHHLVVDQPVEAGGDDIGPTPTELFVASYAACVAFYAERFLRRHDLPVDGLNVAADFQIGEGHPARVSEVRLRIEVPAELSAGRRAAMLAVVQHCTVGNTIAQPPKLALSIEAPYARVA